MKINYKNTALNLLDIWDEEYNLPQGFPKMLEKDRLEFAKSVLNNIPEHKGLFRNKTQLISESFFEAYIKTKHKFADIFLKEDIETSGTWIWSLGSFTQTAFYYYKTVFVNGEWQPEYLYIQFSKYSKNDFKSLDVYISGHNGVQKTFICDEHYNNGYTHDYFLAFLVGFTLFTKYVEIETKIIAPNKKEKHIGIKYLNETKNSIEILDSTWFTTLVVSGAFDVSAHLRWQVCGPNLSERKLKWINGFQKEGYTRKARKLLHEN